MSKYGGVYGDGSKRAASAVSEIETDRDRGSVFDSRVYLFLMVGSLVSAFLIHNEISLTLLFVVGLVWQGLAGKSRNILMFVVGFILLWIITSLSFAWLAYDTSAVLPLTLSNMGLSGRRALTPLMFALLLAQTPTGSLLASFNVLRIPKSVGIAVAIALRFFPTVGNEYRSIRNAQRFRNVGVGIVNTLTHLPRTLDCILIPLIIRITRISDELSASITVRGMRFTNEVVSFRPIGFLRKDIMGLSLTLLIMLVLVFADAYLGGYGL